MQVKMFSAVISPGSDSLEAQVNQWLESDPDSTLLDLKVNMSHSEGQMMILVTALYEEEDDGGDYEAEMTVTLPHIRIGELHPLTPRLR